MQHEEVPIEPGIRCRKCGCIHLRVASSVLVIGGRRRVRVCRNCGTQQVTIEAATIIYRRFRRGGGHPGRGGLDL